MVLIPYIRSAALDGYAQLARSLGLDAERQVTAAGLDPADLDAPDRWVPAAAAARLLETSAVASGAEDLGLRLSEWRRLATLGPLSVVLREEPDLRSALELLIRHERSYNEAVSVQLTEAAGLATLRISLGFGAPAPTRQALELAVAAYHGIVRDLRGNGWHAEQVCFPHPAPERLATHRRLFGPGVRFGCGFAGLVFRSRDLASVNVLADPLMRPYLPQLMRVLPEVPARALPDRVRELVETLLPVGRASMRQVARALGTTPRTLRRRLERDGAGFTSIVDDVRATNAERYLADAGLSLTDVGRQLGFTAPSAFSRWFRRRFGMSPTAWRRAASATRRPGGALRR